MLVEEVFRIPPYPFPAPNLSTAKFACHISCVLAIYCRGARHCNQARMQSATGLNFGCRLRVISPAIGWPCNHNKFIGNSPSFSISLNKINSVLQDQKHRTETWYLISEQIQKIQKLPGPDWLALKWRTFRKARLKEHDILSCSLL